MEDIPLYPLKFNPIFKDKIWGGQKLKTRLGKDFHEPSIGESWELSAVPNNVSIVSEGDLKGANLQTLIERYKGDLVGNDVFKTYGTTFPLLFKFIDAKEVLSVQLHPNDELAKKRHNSFGKTEMWYVMQADDGAELIIGFNQPMTKEMYIEGLDTGNLSSLLKKVKVKEGDVFYIKPGCIHAIGKGVLLAEIQQTSDITYRVYDWGRKDNNGLSRELHTDLALDALDFSENQEAQISYNKATNSSEQLVHNAYFKTNLISIAHSTKHLDMAQRDSFTVLMCVKGVSILKTDRFKTSFKQGETILIPASINNVEITADNAKILEVSL